MRTGAARTTGAFRVGTRGEGTATIEVKRLFYGDASSVGEARLFVRDALSETDAPEDVVDSAVLLVSELATNVALHARTHVRVTVRFEGESLWAEVKDWNSRLPQACLPPDDATTGRGLKLVEAIASSWGVERDSDGKVVWFQLHVAASVLPNGAVGNGVSADRGLQRASGGLASDRDRNPMMVADAGPTASTSGAVPTGTP
ncbi:MAG: ATP-binding protein [Actinomycetota bacterium]|nr:ATP-binding protein [Actinomycetota bacterium]